MSRDREAIVLDALRRNAHPGSAPLARDTRLAGLLDSLAMVVLLLDLETALGGRPFDVARVGRLVTVGDLLDAVSNGGTG